MADVCIGALHGFRMAGSTLTVVRTQDQLLLEQAMRERQIKMPSKPWQHLPPQLHHYLPGAYVYSAAGPGPAHQQPPMMPNGAPMPPLPPAPSNGPMLPAMQWSNFMGASPAPWGARPPPGPAPPPGGPMPPVGPPHPPPGARPYAQYWPYAPY